MAKKILIHSLIFSPDGVSTAYLYNDIALKFQECGFQVVVLTTTPHYNVVESQLAQQPLKWKIPGICKESHFHGIRVIHVPQKKFKNTFLRLLGFTYWHIVSFVIGLFIKKVNVILSPSPPLTIGLLNFWLGKIKNCKVVYNVQEIYPDILHLSKESFIFKILNKIEHKVYNGSDKVTTIDRVFYDAIADRFNDRNKLHIIPNFVDTELYRSGISMVSLNKMFFPETDHLKLCYAGNIGFAQDWDTLINLAEKTIGSKIEYFVIGEGVKKTYLEEAKNRHDLMNLHILSYQPRSLMPAILAYSDVQFIFMNPKMEKQGFPSKVYTIMACGKPLLVCSGENTPIVDFLQPLDCARLITNSDMDVKTDEIIRWLDGITHTELRQMGVRGVEIVEHKYAKEIVTRQYVDLINSIIE